MELLFFYIEDFRSLERQGFNFSPELVFDIEELQTNNKLRKAVDARGKPNYRLNIELNKEYVQLFDSHILNITGIIGKNGSGKSTLLHCLKLFAGQLQLLTSSLVFCILDTDRKAINTYYYHGGGPEMMAVLEVNVQAKLSVKSKYKVNKPVPYRLTRMGVDANSVKNLDFSFKDIFSCSYSNVFDSHPEQLYEGIENISTNYKVEVFFKKYLNEKINEAKKSDKGKDIVLWPSHIADFHKQERKLILEFLAYANSRQLDRIPELPRRMVVKFNFEDYEYILTDKRSSRRLNTENLKALHQLAAELLHRSKDPRQNFEWLTLLCTFYYILRWYNPDVSMLFNDTLDVAIKEMVKAPDKLFFAIRNVLRNMNIVAVEVPQVEILNQILGRRFSSALKSIKFIEEEYTPLSKTRFDVTIDRSLWPVLALIHDLSSFETSSFLDYDWYGGLSTGEESILLHSARLFAIKNKVKGRPIWLFIDEGDLYFHPERQKTYLRHLLDVIKLLFGQTKSKVQVILTTHSPFIVSDLPKQNLIFMTRENHQCVVKRDKLASNTFGANIHDLFNESFFIDGALIGDFAKSKIEEIIAWLQKQDKMEGAEQIRMLINVVGEPIIKTKLTEMFAKKMGEDTELARLQAQEEYIKLRIAQIKGND